MRPRRGPTRRRTWASEQSSPSARADARASVAVTCQQRRRAATDLPSRSQRTTVITARKADRHSQRSGRRDATGPSTDFLNSKTERQRVSDEECEVRQRLLSQPCLGHELDDRPSVTRVLLGSCAIDISRPSFFTLSQLLKGLEKPNSVGF